MTNVEMLLGKLGAKRISLSEFARRMKFSRPTARRKVYGEVDFTVAEVNKAADLLDLSPIDVLNIFFAERVAKMATC